MPSGTEFYVFCLRCDSRLPATIIALSSHFWQPAVPWSLPWIGIPVFRRKSLNRACHFLLLLHFFAVTYAAVSQVGRVQYRAEEVQPRQQEGSRPVRQLLGSEGEADKEKRWAWPCWSGLVTFSLNIVCSVFLIYCCLSGKICNFLSHRIFNFSCTLEW